MTAPSGRSTPSLRAALDVAVRDDPVQRNVASVVERALAGSAKAGHLTAGQASALLRTMEGERLAPQQAREAADRLDDSLDRRGF